MKFKLLILLSLTLFHPTIFAIDKSIIRVGVLPFGTVHWALTALDHAKMTESDNFLLKVQEVVTPQAGKIAILSGAVDVVVADWIWVSRQRATGSDLAFYPYSNTTGALIVANDSTIKSIRDLEGKKLGIAGGELDKNWLLLQALAMKTHQINLDQSVEKIFAAPPILNQQLLRGRVDAIINYWHFAAKMEAQGYRQIINGAQILKRLNISAQVPTLGYVFNRSWALKNQHSLNNFLQATQKAREKLCTSDTAWQEILPLTKTNSTSIQDKLRKRYCSGNVHSWGAIEQKSAEQIYSLLKLLSHNRLTGDIAKIQPGTFWNFMPVQLQ